MRKVTENAAYALKMGATYRNGNTTVSKPLGTSHTTELRLHGNLIARFVNVGEQPRVELYDAGWTSATTKERLNGVLQVFNSQWRIYQLQGNWYVTDGMGVRHEWHGTAIIDNADNIITGQRAA